MADTKTNRMPEPLITCVLPEYEDRHVWWLILQYLQDSGFNHTASAFTLELSTKGVKGEELKALPKEDLHKHIACLLTRQLVGPSAAAAVLPRSGGAAAKETGKGKGTPQKTAQQEKASRRQQAAATPRTQKSGCISPMDIDQRHPQRLDQTEHEKHQGRQQQQKTPTKPAAGEHQPKKQSLAPTQQQSTAAAAVETKAMQQQDKPSAAAAQNPAAAALPSPAAAAAPSAATDMPAAAAAITASAAAVVPMLNVSRVPSVTATGEGEETLDFGDAEDEEAAPTADMEHDQHVEEPLGSDAAEEGEHREEQQDQPQEEVAEAKDATGHKGTGQPSAAAELQQQPSGPRASSDGRPQLKRGKPPVAAAPAHPAHSDGKSRSHSRSRGRSHSRSRGRNSSRERSHSRSHSSSRSRSKNRHRSYSRSSRSRSPHRSRSRSRSYDSRSHSRDNRRSSRSRSRSRDRGRSNSRSRSRDRDRDNGRHHRSGYQSHWQTNRQGSGSYQGRGGSSYNANGGYHKYGTGRGGFVTYHATNKYDSQDRRGGGEYGTAGGLGTYQRGRGRGRYDFNSSSRGGRGGYQQRGQGRTVCTNAHNNLRNGEHDVPTRAPYHHPEGSEEGEALPHHMARSGSAPPEHTGSDGGPAGVSAGDRERADSGAPHGAHSSRSPDDDGDYNRAGDRGLMKPFSFGRGRGRGGRGAFGRHGAAAAGGDDHWQAPAADGVAEADGTAGAPKAVGKEGGKFDWPPRDASGKPILNAVPPAAGGDRTGGRLGGRRHSMPVDDRGHWGGSGGRGPRERFVQPGAGRRPLITLKSGLVVGDVPADGEVDAGGGSGSYNIDNDRWRADDEERGSRSQSRERSPRGGAAAAADRDADRAPEQQQQFVRHDGAADGRDGSPSHTAAAAAAAAGGMSGAHVVAKRRISGTGGAMITDLSGATSQDSPHRGGGVASPADTDAGGPTKKLRASSPGVQS